MGSRNVALAKFKQDHGPAQDPKNDGQAMNEKRSIEPRLKIVFGEELTFSEYLDHAFGLFLSEAPFNQLSNGFVGIKWNGIHMQFITKVVYHTATLVSRFGANSPNLGFPRSEETVIF